MAATFIRTAFLTSMLMLLLGGGVLRAEDKEQKQGNAAAKAQEKAGKAKADQKKADMAAAAKKFATLKVPKDGDSKALAKFIAEVKLHRPRSFAEFIVLRRKVKSAADAILNIEKDKKSETYKDALADSMESSAALISLSDAKTQEAEFEQFKKQISDIEDLSVGEVRLALSVARSLENSESYELAARAFTDFASFFAKNESTQKYSEIFENSLNRVQLIGKPIDVLGVKLDGSEFDLQTLKGKVVLIDFWATWCGPCIAEFPNLRKMREKYGEKGFEIVGISLDQNRKKLESFVSEKKVPWIILHDEKSPGSNPVAMKYGISAIPAMFLVNREGKVISLNARGGRLETLLEQEFE